MSDYKSKCQLIEERLEKMNQELETLIFDMQTDLGLEPSRFIVGTCLRVNDKGARIK